MNRRQLSLLVVLGLISSIPARAADPSEQGGGWRTSSEQAADSTLSGKLYRNAADPGGSAPYVLLDRWGVTRGYVAAAQGVELESRVGQQVSLQGTVKTLPGGDMPYMTCQRVLGGGAETAHTAVERASAPVRHESSAAVVQDERTEEIAPQPGLSARSDMAADDPQERPAQAPPRRAAARHSHSAGVQSASYQETLPEAVPTGEFHRSSMAAGLSPDPTPMEEGPMASEGPMAGHDHAGCDGCGAGPCNAGCGEGPCNTCCGEAPCNVCCDNGCGDICWGPRRPLYCWGPTGIWVKADYLQWWESGEHVPALVTTGGTAGEGIIGQPDTQVLFGDGTINDKSVSGGRIQAGMWLNPCATIGIEGEFFALADENTNYYLWSDGNPVVSRPFFDANPSVNAENVQNVAFPRGSLNSSDGAINISAISRFHGAGAHFLFTMCRQECCSNDECCCGETYHDRFRADFVAGYRYLDLEDQLGITETITSTEPIVPTSPTSPGQNYLNAFLVHDQFNTQNTFNGGDLGMKFEFVRNRWSLDLFPRIALGDTHSTVDISGFTRNTNAAGQESTLPGGLLAQSTNIGHYTQDNFAVVPELDANIGFQLTCHTKVVFGYSGLYWSSVARAGEQIDRTVNSSLIPFAPSTALAPGASAATPARPQFSFQDTGFWAQGINVGLDCRW